MDQKYIYIKENITEEITNIKLLIVSLHLSSEQESLGGSSQTMAFVCLFVFWRQLGSRGPFKDLPEKPCHLYLIR
jgi:hypothetical protein